MTAEPVSESDTEEVFDELDEPEEPAHEIELCSAEIPTLRYGDCGAAVAALQAALRHLGYDPTWIDGEFGERTEACVIDFQNDAGIDTDSPGTVCRDTWEELMRG